MSCQRLPRRRDATPDNPRQGTSPGSRGGDERQRSARPCDLMTSSRRTAVEDVEVQRSAPTSPYATGKTPERPANSAVRKVQDMTETITSDRGDRIGFDRRGNGPAVVFVAGAGPHRGNDPVTSRTAGLAADAGVTSMVADQAGTRRQCGGRPDRSRP